MNRTVRKWVWLSALLGMTQVAASTPEGPTSWGAEPWEGSGGVAQATAQPAGTQDDAGERGASPTPPTGFYINVVPTADGLMLSMIDPPEAFMESRESAECGYEVTAGGRTFAHRVSLESALDGEMVEGYCSAGYPADFAGAVWPIEGAVIVTAFARSGELQVAPDPVRLTVAPERLSSTAAMQAALERGGFTIVPSDATPNVGGHAFSYIWVVSSPLGEAELSITEGRMEYLSAVDCGCAPDAAAPHCTVCGRSHRVEVSSLAAGTVQLLHALIGAAIE